MKKWILGGISLCIVGVVVICGAMAALDWDFERLDNTNYEQKTYACAPEEVVERVELKVDSFPVEIVSGSEVKLDYWQGDEEVAVEVQEGVLRIQTPRRKAWEWIKQSWFGFGKRKHVYILTLPEGVALSVQSTNADVKITDMTIASMYVDSTNLDIRCSACSFGEVAIDGTNADVTLRDCTAAETKISGTNLDVDIEGGSYQSLTVDGTNLDAHIETTSPTIAVHGTNLDMGLDAEFRSLRVTGTNLDADLYVRGRRYDYTVESHGRSLPASQTGTTDKTIYLKGTNNDVKLRFSLD